MIEHPPPDPIKWTLGMTGQPLRDPCMWSTDGTGGIVVIRHSSSGGGKRFTCTFYPVAVPSPDVFRVRFGEQLGLNDQDTVVYVTPHSKIPRECLL